MAKKPQPHKEIVSPKLEMAWAKEDLAASSGSSHRWSLRCSAIVLLVGDQAQVEPKRFGAGQIEHSALLAGMRALC